MQLAHVILVVSESPKILLTCSLGFNPLSLPSTSPSPPGPSVHPRPSVHMLYLHLLSVALKV